MSTLTHGYAAPHVYRGLASLAVEAVGHAAERTARAWQEHRDRRVLSGLSDAALADMGIGRGFEEEAVRHGRDASVMPAGWTEWR